MNNQFGSGGGHFPPQSTSQQSPFFQQNSAFRGGNSASPFGRPSTPNQPPSFFQNAPFTQLGNTQQRGSNQQVGNTRGAASIRGGVKPRGGTRGGAPFTQSQRGGAQFGQQPTSAQFPQQQRGQGDLQMTMSGESNHTRGRGGANSQRGRGTQMIRGGGRGSIPQSNQSHFQQTSYTSKQQVPSLFPQQLFPSQTHQRGRGKPFGQNQGGQQRGGMSNRSMTSESFPQSQSFGEQLKSKTQVLGGNKQRPSHQPAMQKPKQGSDVDMNSSMTSVHSGGRQRQPPASLNRSFTENTQNLRTSRANLDTSMNSSVDSNKILSQSVKNVREQSARIPSSVQRPLTPQHSAPKPYVSQLPALTTRSFSKNDPKSKPTPVVLSKTSSKKQAEEEEEDAFEDDYYDDEEEGEAYYDEEDEAEFEDGDEGEEELGKTFASPIAIKENEAGLKTPITKTTPKVATETGKAPFDSMRTQIIGMIKQFKTTFKGAESICEFFLSNSCTYGAQCKNSHDPKIQASFNLIIAPIIEEAAAKSHKPEVEASKPDLRHTMLAKKDRDPIPIDLPPREKKQPPRTEDEQYAPLPPPSKKKTLNPAALKDSIELPERPQIVQQDRQIVMPLRNPQPVLQRQPSTTARTAAVIRQKQVDFIREFQKLAQDKAKHILPGKAECIGMCPEQEIIQRGQVEVSSIDGFEMSMDAKNFQLLAIKKYSRSAADKVMSDPPMVRPPEILYKTVEYLRECIVDLDRISEPAPYRKSKPSFGDVYSFVRDRFKSITQDFGIVDMSLSQHQIMAMEEICRFMICSTHDGFTEDHFDMKQHMDIINSNLTALKKSYDFIRFKFPNESDPYRIQCLQNEAEFLSYWILNFPDNPVVTAGIINQLDVTRLFKDVKQQQLVREAINLSAIISNGHNSEYFRYMKTTQNYMIACFLLKFLNQKRRSVVSQLIQSRTTDPTVKKRLLKVSELMDSLFFYDEEEVLSFAECCGFVNFVKLQNNEPAFTIEDRIMDREQDEKFKTYQQKSALEFLDVLLGDKSRCQLIQTPLQVSFVPTLTKNLKHGQLPPSTQITVSQQPRRMINIAQPQVQPQLFANAQSAQSVQNSKLSPPQSEPPAASLNPPAIVIAPKDLPQKPIIEAKPVPDELAKQKEVEEQAKQLALQKKAAEARKQALEEERQRQLERQLRKEEEERVQKQLEKDIEWGDQNDKFTRWSAYKIKCFNQQLVADIKKLLHFKKTLSGQKNLAESLQDEQLKDYLQESVALIPEAETKQKVADTFVDIIMNSRDTKRAQLHIMPWGHGSFDMAKLSTQILSEECGQEGVFRFKMFYHKATKESAISSDIIECLEHEIFSKTKSENESIHYNFKCLEFPGASNVANQAKADCARVRNEELMHAFMGTNLLVIFSTTKSLLSDIKKVKEAFALCPEHTSFTVLWILHKTGEKINVGEATIRKDFENELRLNKLSSLHVSTVYAKSPAPKVIQTKKRAKGTVQVPKISIKNAVLAFIVQDLQEALKLVQIYPRAKKTADKIKFAELSQQLEEKLGDIFTIIHSNDQKVVNQILRKLALKHTTIFKEDYLTNEIITGNYLLLMTKEVLKEVRAEMVASIRQISHQLKFSQFNLDIIKQIESQLQAINQLINASPLIAPSDFASQEGQAVLRSKVEQWLKSVYTDHSVINPILAQIKHLYNNQQKLHESRDKQMIIFRGASIFKFLVQPMFTKALTGRDTYYFINTLPPDDVSVENRLLNEFEVVRKQIDSQSKKLEKVIALNREAEGRQAKENEKLFKARHIPKKTQAELLREEIKLEMDPQRLENKRKEAIGKKVINLSLALENCLDDQAKERLQKVLEDGQTALDQSLKFSTRKQPTRKLFDNCEKLLQEESEQIESDLAFIERATEKAKKKRARR